MKFRITMKDPDGVNDSLKEAAEARVAKIAEASALDGEEREALLESTQEKLSETISRWFEYGEYLDVEVDTEAGTCVVVKR